MPYLVQFSGTKFKPGKGFTEGYKTAKRAKEVVAAWNAKGFVDVKYLGNEKTYRASKIK